MHGAISFTVIMIVMTNENRVGLKMLGTFPQEFSQAATSQGFFPKWQLSKCAISQAATSQRLG